MFAKVLVANRGEIAVRAFRAAYELGVRTVAVFPHEDRNSLHRMKADEAYQIGEPGHPVRAYLSVAEIVAAARRAELTQRAADDHPGRMAALLGATIEQATDACAAAPDACWIANDNAAASSPARCAAITAWAAGSMVRHG